MLVISISYMYKIQMRTYIVLYIVMRIGFNVHYTYLLYSYLYTENNIGSYYI